MGVAACTRFETACKSPARQQTGNAVLLGSETRILAQPEAYHIEDADDPNLCGPPALQQAEKLLLSPLWTRSRPHARLVAELSCVTQIVPRDIKPGTRIGTGTWSIVFAGEWQGQPVALKVFKSAGTNSQEQERRWQMFLKEAKMLQDLENPHIVKLLGVFAGVDSCPCLVAELLEGGTLHELLHGRRKSHKLALEPVHRFLLAIHISDGLSYLHSLSVPIVHRDIKSKNVVLMRKPPDSGPPLAAKIIDFGLAEYVQEDGTIEDVSLGCTAVQCGSASYMAPECFVSPCCLSTKIDTWALGCVLVEIFGGAPPHTDCEDHQQVSDKLLIQRIGPDVPSHVDLAAGSSADASVNRMLQGCLDFDDTKRWSAAVVLERLQAVASERGLQPGHCKDLG